MGSKAFYYFLFENVCIHHYKSQKWQTRFGCDADPTKSHWMKLNQTNWKQTKPIQTETNLNQTKHNQTILNQTKPNQSWSSKSKPNLIKFNQTNPDQSEPNQNKPNQFIFHTCMWYVSLVPDESEKVKMLIFCCIRKGGMM